ncbi:MAG: hypothetical protein QM724_12220 [Flavobacteriales bacterium]
MERHLSALSILHYVYGVFICLVGLTLLSLVFIGQAMDSNWLLEQGGEAAPPFVGFLLRGLGWALFLFVEAVGILNLVSAGLIQRRKGRVFSEVVAAIDCLSIPFGLALGVFTFVVLSDHGVRMQYGGASR